jgi:hypothetical protein
MSLTTSPFHKLNVSYFCTDKSNIFWWFFVTILLLTYDIFDDEDVEFCSG